jgi:hypothetical protein
MLATQSHDFIRVTSAILAAAEHYGKFITDANVFYTGCYILNLRWL